MHPKYVTLQNMTVCLGYTKGMCHTEYYRCQLKRNHDEFGFDNKYRYELVGGRLHPQVQERLLKMNLDKLYVLSDYPAEWSATRIQKCDMIAPIYSEQHFELVASTCKKPLADPGAGPSKSSH